MKPTPPAVGDFRTLWKEQFGQDITDEQAEAYEERLVRLLKLLLDAEAKERAPP